jgi:hypothetical protein
MSFLFAYILVRFMQKLVGHTEGLLLCLRMSSKICLHMLWSQIYFLDCSDQKYNVDA